MAEVLGAVETELRALLKLKPPSAKESRQEYLNRVLVKVGQLDDDAWSTSLSPESQTWANEAARARNHKKDLPDFPIEEVAEGEAEAEAATEGEEAGEAEEAEPAVPPARAKAAKAAGGKVITKPPVKAKPAKSGSETGPAQSVDGVKNGIKRLVFDNPNWTAEQVYDALIAAGEAPSRLTVSGIRAEFRHTLRFLDSIGALIAPFATKKRGT